MPLIWTKLSHVEMLLWVHVEIISVWSYKVKIKRDKVYSK